MSNREDIHDALNSILQFLYDSQACFTKHVENVSDEHLKVLFHELTISRQRMLTEIMGTISTFGEKPEVRGTFLGKTHMVFENLKSMLMGGDPLSITKEVRRGEGVLIEYYKHALSLTIPNDLRQLLLKHLNKIEDDIKEADILSVE